MGPLLGYREDNPRTGPESGVSLFEQRLPGFKWTLLQLEGCRWKRPMVSSLKVLGPHGLNLSNVIPSRTFCFQIT